MSRALELTLETLTHTAHNWLAFSGGPDSLCLLHLLVQARQDKKLTVVHIDHGLDEHSAARAQRAQQLTHQLGLDCRIERLESDDLNQPGGTEAAARHARYARFQSLMSTDDHLLTAHHADDQIETLLLRLLRGSGARGVSGMQSKRRLEPGWLTRPLLHWTQQQIHDYLEHHQLTAINDPTNLDCSFDRNYLRQRVLPIIAERWPGYRSSLLQSSKLIDAAGRALEAQAELDFQDLSGTRGDEITLRLADWINLETVRALEVIRHWCRTQSIEAPNATQLKEFLDQCRLAQDDRQPALDWQPATLRRWSGALWLDQKPHPPPEWQRCGTFNNNQNLDIKLPHGLGRLLLSSTHVFKPESRWQIDSGKPGDRLPLGSMSRTASELMRTAGIPPWRRSHWPRLRLDGQLIAIGDQWIGQPSITIRWLRADEFDPDC